MDDRASCVDTSRRHGNPYCGAGTGCRWVRVVLHIDGHGFRQCPFYSPPVINSALIPTTQIHRGEPLREAQ